MRFNISTALTAVLAVTQANAQLSAQDIVDNINEITQLSADTAKIATGINFLNGFFRVPKLVYNFGEIITMVTKDIAAMKVPVKRESVEGSTIASRQNGDDFTERSQHAICNAFVNFVKVHQALLNTIIGEAGIIRYIPASNGLANILQALEKGVDTLAFGIIGQVPTCADEAGQALNRLDGTIEDAQSKF